MYLYDMASSELLEHLENKLFFVRAELHDGLANEFLSGVSEDVEFGLVGPEDDAIFI